jgi:hypothetical protein
MNAKDLRTIKAGDKIKFKQGYTNHGCRAIFLRMVPETELKWVLNGRNAPTVEYEFAGQVKQLPHNAFTLDKPAPAYKAQDDKGWSRIP